MNTPLYDIFRSFGQNKPNVGASSAKAASNLVMLFSKAKKRSRRKLDQKLLMGEYEHICGLEKEDGLFGLGSETGNTNIRRIEIMCHAHIAEKETIRNRVLDLESKQSLSHVSVEINNLKMRLEEIGDYPSKMERALEDLKQMKRTAKAKAISQEVRLLAARYSNTSAEWILT